jgi:valyl-tRNA synthetase
LVKLEDYRTKIGYSERTDVVVEPRLTLQWFLDMKLFAQTAREAVAGGEVRFFPDHFQNMYNSWLAADNIRDWCISRQLWWGQRIPAWYLAHEKMGEETAVFVAHTPEEALAQAQAQLGRPDLTLHHLRQDEDVVDTWFSSWLWPITVFDGFERQDELRYYYPTNVLVTGWDIMFFWVARMIMSGYEWSPTLLGAEQTALKGAMPFRDVYFTGMVRDNKRRKMSKSLGNSPDALSLIENYGADGVRFGMLASGAAGNDIIFDAPFDPVTNAVLNESKLCEQGRNFCNKMWNALRLIKGWEVADVPADQDTRAVDRLAGEWMQQRLLQVTAQLETLYQDYRLSDALMAIYKLVWDDFCSWYLEMVKPAYEAPVYRETLENTLALFEKMMTLLHPFMPFVTEEIWHQLRARGEGEDCVVSAYPLAASFDQQVIQQVELAKAAVSGIREIRNAKGIKAKEPLTVKVQDSPTAGIWLSVPGIVPMIEKMAALESLATTSGEVDNSVALLAGNEKLFVVLQQEINAGEERTRLEKELEYYRGFIASVQKKLENERFVQSAPEAVVQKEQQKLADGLLKLKGLEAALQQLE